MQAIWMVLSAFLIASMGVCVKFASAYFTSAELVFYRGVVSVVFMAAYAHIHGTSLRTRYAGMHAWRSVIGVTSLSAWFYAIGHLPLATAMTLNYMSGVWIAAFLVPTCKSWPLVAWASLKYELCFISRSAPSSRVYWA